MDHGDITEVHCACDVARCLYRFHQSTQLRPVTVAGQLGNKASLAINNLGVCSRETYVMISMKLKSRTVSNGVPVYSHLNEVVPSRREQLADGGHP